MVSLVHAARDIGRIREISTVLARHGFGEIVTRLGFAKRTPEGQTPEKGARPALSRGERIRRVLEELGPSFVKLGQIASTRADLLPTDVIAELRKLQDAVPPVSFDAIRERVESALGASLEELFVSVEREPLAAASIAQVHRAVLKSDEGEVEVVLKVQRPNIEQVVASDLDLLHSFATLLERAVPESRIYSPVALVHQFDHAITSELDFTNEAENIVRFRQNFAGVPGAYFPRVYKTASSKRVITLEFLRGHKIYEAIAQGFSPQKLARLAIGLVVKQIFDDGFFHADPHPGNVIVLGTPEQPVYALVDLGMVGRLSPRMRDLTVDLMVAAVRKDYDSVADALYAIGTPTKKIDMNAYRSEVALLADRYLGKQLKDIEISSLVRDLASAASRYGIEIPPDFLLVGKALMTLEGIGKEIDPTLDVFEEVRPFFLELMRKRYSPERVGVELLKRLERMSGATSYMPEQIREVLDDLRLGRLVVTSHDPLRANAIDRLGRRLQTAFLTSALVLAGAWLLTRDSPRLGAALIVLSGLWLTGHLILSAYRGWQRR